MPLTLNTTLITYNAVENEPYNVIGYGLTCFQSAAFGPSNVLACYNIQDDEACIKQEYLFALGIHCVVNNSVSNASLVCSYDNDVVGAQALRYFQEYDCDGISTPNVISCSYPLSQKDLDVHWFRWQPNDILNAGYSTLCQDLDTLSALPASSNDGVSTLHSPPTAGFCFYSSLYYRTCTAKSASVARLLPPLSRLLLYFVVAKELFKLFGFCILSVFSSARHAVYIHYVTKNVSNVVYIFWHKRTFVRYLTRIRVAADNGAMRLVALDVFLQQLPQLLYTILYMWGTQSIGSPINGVSFFVSLGLTTYSTFTILRACGLTCFEACAAVHFEDDIIAGVEEQQRPWGVIRAKEQLVKQEEDKIRPSGRQVHVLVSVAQEGGSDVEMTGVSATATKAVISPSASNMSEKESSYRLPPSGRPLLGLGASLTPQQLNAALQDEAVRALLVATLQRQQAESNDIGGSQSSTN